MSEREDDKVTEFQANPVQKRFIESRAEADLFSSRKGEGKSAALCWACWWHTQHNPGARWLFLRDTWENLKRTTLEEFMEWFDDYGLWVAGDKVFHWDEQKTGMRGKVYWMGAEGDEDAQKIASMPLGGIALDEPAPAAGTSVGISEFVFDTAFAQLRQKGMKWYGAKLAQNNPDETHWTYRRFVDPGTPPDPDIPLLPDQDSGFIAHQTKEPENLANLKPGYYEGLEKSWKHRPDLIRRFVKGEYGYQQVGRAVTPEWRDEIHLTQGIEPMSGVPLYMLWDGGHNPTCIITQVTTLGYWLILESHVGHRIGMYQLIKRIVKPRLSTRFRGFTYEHVGDPNLKTPEQTDIKQSAARVITTELGGRFYRGVDDVDARVDPLRNVLTQTINGVGMVQVDRKHAREVWHALRGGWHWHISRGGAAGSIVKDQHSHPGDCMGYGAARYFPMGQLQKPRGKAKMRQNPSYYRRHPHPGTSMGMARKGVKVPEHGTPLEGKNNGREKFHRR